MVPSRVWPVRGRLKDGSPQAVSPPRAVTFELETEKVLQHTHRECFGWIENSEFESRSS